MLDIDPIIGIRRFREKFAAEHNYDIRAMSATLRRICEEHGHIGVSPATEVEWQPRSTSSCSEESPVVGGSTVV